MKITQIREKEDVETLSVFELLKEKIKTEIKTSPVFLLLVGAQGIHKSTFCRDLIPPEPRGYYADSIDLSRKRECL